MTTRVVESAVAHAPGSATKAVGLGKADRPLEGDGTGAVVGDLRPSLIRVPHPTANAPARSVASKPAGRHKNRALVSIIEPHPYYELGERAPGRSNECDASWSSDPSRNYQRQSA